MKQSLLLSIVLLLLSSSSLVTPIHARNKSHPAKSPVGAPAPGPSGADCSSVILNMMDCLTYLSIGSNETMPEKSCCDGIETVLKFNPQCICSGLVSANNMGIELNNTRALATPKTCKLSISPPHCGMMTPSGTTPGASPVSPSAGTPKTSPSAAKSPATSPSSDETPSKTAPSPTSGTSIISVPALTIVAVLVSSIAYISAFPN
ncbi:PREDICTED: non-specific lipid-transfer protein-like protein At5g64080 isoform X1 [Camelina sativa]|uniref:Non-specific lipid-transfer protein-like protein At5g64080 isoform X1 n=1 Tax=Camelina sativa TaxID=90675 RepID=A0ABM0T6W0_CAMSA|nr:PREDICTED: non-specific lipid-transfer protein-like protein At5g64080 isoform X1 [Camelina sativa]